MSKKSRKPRRPKDRIYVTRLDGKPIAHVRHYTQRQAHALAVGGRVVTEEATVDDLMRIGREGIEIGGVEPDVDPNQMRLIDGELD